jgi:hypothetical protein
MTTTPADPSRAALWSGLFVAAVGVGWWWSQRAPELPVVEEAPAVAAVARYSTIERAGTPDPLPPPGPAKHQAECRWVMPLPGLEGLSNKALFDTLRVGEASPLVLLRDGVALRGHVQPAAQRCDGAWVHTAAGAVVSPVGGEVEGATWTVGWSADLPARATLDKAPHELWWVYPGTTLRLTFDAAWDPALGEPWVAVDAVAPAGGEGFVVRAGGQEWTLVASAAGGAAEGGFLAPVGPWTVEVVAPSGSGALLVRAVRLGRGPSAVAVLGGAAPSVVAAAAPAAGLALLGQRQPHRVVRSAAPPVALRIEPTVQVDKADGIPRGRIKLGPYGSLSAPEVKAKADKGGCSPLRLTEDGVAQPKPEAAFATLAQVGGGAAATQGGAYVFTASDSSNPSTNGRRYAVGLDPERLCGQSLWLYPGDETQVVVDPASLTGAAALTLRGVAVVGAPADKQIVARLELDGRVALDTSVALEALAGGVALPLAAPGPAGRVVLTLRNPPEGAFVLVTAASVQGQVGAASAASAAAAQPAAVQQPVAEPPPAAEVRDPAPPKAATSPKASGRGGPLDFSAVRQDLKDHSKLALYQTNPGDSRWSPIAGPLGPGLRLESVTPGGQPAVHRAVPVRGRGRREGPCGGAGADHRGGEEPDAELRGVVVRRARARAGGRQGRSGLGQRGAGGLAVGVAADGAAAER